VDSNHDGRIDAEQLLEVAQLVGIKVMSVHHAKALITKYGSRGWQIAILNHCLQISVVVLTILKHIIRINPY